MKKVIQKIYDTPGVGRSGLLPASLPDQLLNEIVKDGTCWTLLSNLCQVEVKDVEQMYLQEVLKRRQDEAQRRIDIEKN